MSALFILIWRRLDNIDKTPVTVQGDLKQFYGGHDSSNG